MGSFFFFIGLDKKKYDIQLMLVLFIVTYKTNISLLILLVEFRVNGMSHKCHYGM